MTCIGFLSGSVMYSYILPKWIQKVDIRTLSEDQNPGSANVMAMTKGMGTVCLILDLAKAFAPVYISVLLMGGAGYYLIPVMTAPVLGHAFSPFLRFRGGKAVSVSFGSLLGVVGISSALLVLIITLLIFNFLIIIRPNSSKIITAFSVVSAAVGVLEPLREIKIAMLLISLIVCYKHIVNPNRNDTCVSIGSFSILKKP